MLLFASFLKRVSSKEFKFLSFAVVSNLKFALEADEDNKQLADEYINVKKLISSDIPSLPTNLNKELKVNPFLRCNEINIKNKVIDKFDIIDDELEIFTALRKWKDNF